MSDETEKPEQLKLDLEIVAQKDVDGLEMGVLSDGTPYLTLRGLARICGVRHSAIQKWADKYEELGGHLDDSKMSEILLSHGFKGGHLYIATISNRQMFHAYPDNICMAFIEYYAFEAGKNKTDQALRVFRSLAKKSLKDFIYMMVGYDPTKIVPPQFKEFHDRVLLNTVPANYFSIFREIIEVTISCIQQGLKTDHHTIIDGSVGVHWSRYWSENDLDTKYGSKAKWPHRYPEYFPQAKANDYIEANVYPLEALGEFRLWLRKEYLPKKFPTYINNKVRDGAITATSADLLLKAVEPPPELPGQ